MTKRNIVLTITACLTVISIFGIIFGIYAIQDITITEQEIKNRVSEKIPIEKNGITLTSLNIDFKNTSLNLTAHFNGKKWNQEFTAIVSAQGVPFYDNGEGAFYFKPENITIQAITIKEETVSTKVKKFIDKFVDSLKINKNADAIGTKSEKWFNVSVENTAAMALQNIPIYKLPHTAKGITVRMFLKAVEIRNGNLILHLSVWQFTKTVLLSIVTFLISIAIAFVLLQNPGWGAASFIDI
ncbi:MAG: DUF1439 domain-containing protein [Parcubacteria group bacterium]|nr:DUF1439 domain-containing protein [Parcubacteria group bacterium]